MEYTSVMLWRKSEGVMYGVTVSHHEHVITLSAVSQNTRSGYTL